MKGRVRQAIDSKIYSAAATPELRKQATLIHNAHIQTIDSFCNWVVKNYFYKIDQEPAFRIANKGELRLLSDKVISDIIAKKFEAKAEGFIFFADAYIEGRSVSSLKENVYQLYNKAMSYPWPDEWLEQSLRLYEVDSYEQFCESDFVVDITKKVKQKIITCKKYINAAKAEYLDSAAKSMAALDSDLELFSSIEEAASFDELYRIFAGVKFATYRTKDEEFASDFSKEAAKGYRDLSKKYFTKIKEKYFSQSLEAVYEDLIFVKSYATELVELVKEYKKELSKLKKKKNIFDFNDIEHMALEILRNPATAEHECTSVALELKEHFAEVMVDEYQDSNDLQESILTAVAKSDNYFTVGDVKQSIYAFRQASPQLFMDKFTSYAAGKEASVRIDLDKNFRSRLEVLDFCNDVFLPLMKKDMGNVEYDTAATLKLGACDYPENADAYKPEILIGQWDEELAKSFGIKKKDIFEAQLIADRIKKLVADGFLVTTVVDGKKALRPIKYSDIVILMRATSAHAGEYIKVFEENSIPAFVEEETGFFDRDEVQTLLAMLEIIDNPYNDISLASVLHSGLFNISIEKLAQIRCTQVSAPLFECLQEYYKNNPQDEQVASFFAELNKLQDCMIDTPIHEIIQLILEDTGYRNYIFSLPMGKSAVANINKLIDEAIQFESTSYKGVSKFVSYINELKTYNEDLGLAKIIGQNDNAVRIMTIHKSKGLQFPVVFVSRCGGKFNSLKGDFFYHNKVGLALNYKNPTLRTMSNTLFANLVKDYLTADELGEEQRILYVALTRAQEKLICTGMIRAGGDKNVEAVIADYRQSFPSDTVSFDEKENSKSYLEWILRALYCAEKHYRTTVITANDLMLNKVVEASANQIKKTEIYKLKDSVSDELAEEIQRRIINDYELVEEAGYKAKYSVSEIKHQKMDELFELSNDAQPMFLQKEESYIPDFIKSTLSDEADAVQNAGALYGTIMHRVMECFDFSDEDYKNSLERQIEHMLIVGELSKEEGEIANRKKLKSFLLSDAAARMHQAASGGMLYKEKPFVFGDLPENIFGIETTKSLDENLDDMVLVQGIIDVFWEEEDGLVLLDYKTDKVDALEELVLRYEKQLALYKAAIERMYSKKVKDTFIYSFSLDELIKLF